MINVYVNPMTKSIITLLCAALFLYGIYADIHALRICTKPIPVLMLIWMVLPHNDKWLLRALGFSVLGDMILELPQQLPFALGLGSFLIAHIMYIRRFLIAPVTKIWWPIAPISLYCGILFWYMIPNLGPLLVPVFLYILVIATMLWSANIFSHTHKNYLPFIGAVFFVLSDSLIAINKFIVPFSQARYSIIITYWLAQYLIIIPLISCQAHESRSS